MTGNAQALSKQRPTRFLTSSVTTKPECLSFTRSGTAGFKWWNVTPPQTSYTQAHAALGQAFAFELLDYLQNKNARNKSNVLGYIALEITGERLDTCSGQMLFAFFKTIGNYVAGEHIDK